MELFEHVFYTFAQGEKNGVDLSVARSVHCNSMNLAPAARAALANKIAEVTNPRRKYAALCEVWGRYMDGKIDKATCLSEFKRLTKEVFPNG